MDSHRESLCVKTAGVLTYKTRSQLHPFIRRAEPVSGSAVDECRGFVADLPEAYPVAQGPDPFSEDCDPARRASPHLRGRAPGDQIKAAHKNEGTSPIPGNVMIQKHVQRIVGRARPRTRHGLSTVRKFTHLKANSRQANEAVESRAIHP
jgi:hypothetical protein